MGPVTSVPTDPLATGTVIGRISRGSARSKGQARRCKVFRIFESALNEPFVNDYFGVTCVKSLIVA